MYLSTQKLTAVQERTTSLNIVFDMQKHMNFQISQIQPALPDIYIILPRNAYRISWPAHQCYPNLAH